MKWKDNRPQVGNRRIVFRFLFLPISLGNIWKWLEFAWITQEYEVVGWAMFFGDYKWINKEWGIGILND